jgi:branched-subunit amino acid permease
MKKSSSPKSETQLLRRSLVLLCFTTASGLLAFVSAMFTTMLPLSAGWRYFWLAICVVALGFALIGLVRFILSYKRDKPDDVRRNEK